MNWHPISMDYSLVPAVRSGRKTATRRLLNPQPECWTDSFHGPVPCILSRDGNDSHVPISCPYGEKGDALWVRETWRVAQHHDATKPSAMRPRSMTVNYRAGGFACNDRPKREGTPEWQVFDEEPSGVRFGKWRPPMFMPRWASRITLEITGVRVERLQEITPDDCRAEGVPTDNNDIGVRYTFGQLWNSIYGSWDANPWVWVIEFKRLDALR